MSVTPGTQLGRYEIVEAFAGSDSRFKATDRATGGTVLVTLVAPAVVDGVARERLQQEAVALSAVADAHVCAPTDFGYEPPGPAFVVTPFVEGPTLAERLARGPFPIGEALDIAAAVASVLDQVHRRGVVHRQLTPSAIVLAADGPRLFDFGIAAEGGVAAASGLSSSLLVTRTSALSVASIAPDLVRYTSPEQIAGRISDARSDIFALGAILYEMLAGRPAFQEKTPPLLIAAVQTVDPEPISRVAPGVPPALDHLVGRMLAKDPQQRIQTAWDLLVQLRWIIDAGSKIGEMPRVTRSRPLAVAPWAAVAILAVAVAAGIPAVAARLNQPADMDPVRFKVAGLPPAAPVPVSLSPDGRWLVGSPGGAGSRGVIARSLDSVNTQTLIPAATVTQPFWSPDSKSVAFFDEGRLKRADVAGGALQNICETPLPIGGGTWNRDGVILFAGGGRIYRVLAAGGQPTAVTTPDKAAGETEHVAPAFLPDGRHYLYLAVGTHSGIYVATLDSSERLRLLDADARAIVVPGFVLFNRGNVVFAQPFDADALKLTGEAQRVVDGVATLAQGPNASTANPRFANFTVSQNGVLAFKSLVGAAPGNDEQRSLVWFERSSTVTSQVATSGMFAGLDVSPDGRRFVVHRHEAVGGDLWTYDAALRRMQRLTFDTSQENVGATWSPDGKRIAFTSRRRDRWGIYVKPADGDGAEQLIFESVAPKVTEGWSPDGKLLVYNENDDVWAVPVSGEHKPIPIITSPFIERMSQVSPDGKWIAYQSNETGRNEVYVKQFPSGPARWQVSTEGGQWVRWRANGTELYFATAPNIVSVSVRPTGASLEFGTPVPILTLGADPSVGSHQVPYHRFGVSPDGQRFLMSQPAGGAAAGGGLADRLAQLADGGGGAGGSSLATSNLTVVLNWPRLLLGR